jgi:hypothetical protein
MPRVLLRSFRLKAVVRHVALLAMLVLQAGFVASPLFVHHAAKAEKAHIDKPGSRHVNEHNESTCVVCSVRALHAVVAKADAPLTSSLDAKSAPLDEVPPLALRGALASNPSRAPPSLS